eukprot:g14196.t1 g14196   contig9:1372891-1373693(+)
MVLTDIKDFTAQEVGMWLVAQGMGNHADKFLAEGIDGDLLLSLTAEELKTDLGLPSLQAKKILKNIEFTQSLTSKGDGEGDKVKIHELEDAVKARDVEIEQLKQQLAALTTKEKAAPAPSPKHAPAPASSHHTPQQQRRRGAPVVGGAARGAAGGALKGAVVGAILPGMDAADGAAAGAAAGALGGGLAARRGMRGL